MILYDYCDVLTKLSYCLSLMAHVFIVSGLFQSYDKVHIIDLSFFISDLSDPKQLTAQ